MTTHQPPAAVAPNPSLNHREPRSTQALGTPRRSLPPHALRQLMGVPFTAQQLDAITAPLAPTVVVAGAGSGKTTVMAARVVWLVATGQVEQSQVLGLTFTNKAAAELRARVTSALATAGVAVGSEGADADLVGGEPTVLTYHAYAGQLLRQHGLRIGHEPETRLLTDASRFQLAEQAVRRHHGPISQLTTSLHHVVRYVLHLDGQLADHLVTPGDVRTWQAAERRRWETAEQTAAVRRVLETFTARDELLSLVEGYRALKTERGVMDHSDVMALSAVLAERCPPVGEQERTSFAVVLLDEYQDTSVTQSRLLRALFASGHPVTAVGDPCQAIYGWRGASAGNLDAFPEAFALRRGERTGPADSYPLTVNRRSGTSILEVANVLAQPLYERHRGSQSLQAPAGVEPGEVQAALLETFDEELDHLTASVQDTHRESPDRRWSDIAILVRNHAMGADVHDRLVEAGVPVEVVGLTGLLELPEIRDVVATLEVLHDVTANPALLQLLSGPRWRIGPRDLALLGRQARRIARPRTETGAANLVQALQRAVGGIDATDTPSLFEALLDPGEHNYSAQARLRFAELAAELQALHRHVGEPLLDLVRRVIDVTGIDVELAACHSRHAEARRDNLAAFIDAVAAFAGTETEASLAGLLGYLRAEDEYGDGLPLAVPSQSDSVKVLTVHKAKGLEWDVVFVPGLSRDVFPSGQARARWTTAASELPWPLRGDAADLPSLPEPSAAALRRFSEDCREEQVLEERRLAYVAFTRARRRLLLTGHWWGPRQVRPRGPSVFLDDALGYLQTRGQTAQKLAPEPEDGATNPLDRRFVVKQWPVDAGSEEQERRTSAAALVRQTRAVGWQTAAGEAQRRLQPHELARVDQWDTEIARLLEEAEAGRSEEVVVPLPQSLSATTALRLRSDPARLARELARPMPRPPSAAARFGTRFHSWVEAYVGQQQLLAVDEVPGSADGEPISDAELHELAQAFESGPFGRRRPLHIEAPFTTVLANHALRGRIDAVYEEPSGYLVVDWKTSRAQTADPLQLALYRMAWAELCGVDEHRVRAAFYYVRSGEVVEFDLPGRAELERMWLQDGNGVDSSA